MPVLMNFMVVVSPDGFEEQRRGHVDARARAARVEHLVAELYLGHRGVAIGHDDAMVALVE